jgi:hypothetical protein
MLELKTTKCAQVLLVLIALGTICCAQSKVGPLLSVSIRNKMNPRPAPDPCEQELFQNYSSQLFIALDVFEFRCISFIAGTQN